MSSCTTLLGDIGNRTCLSLLTLIPIFNIVRIFYRRFQGKPMGLAKGDYKDVATFKAIQETWNCTDLI